MLLFFLFYRRRRPELQVVLRGCLFSHTYMHAHTRTSHLCKEKPPKPFPTESAQILTIFLHRLSIYQLPLL